MDIARRIEKENKSLLVQVCLRCQYLSTYSESQEYIQGCPLNSTRSLLMAISPFQISLTNRVNHVNWQKSSLFFKYPTRGKLSFRGILGCNKYLHYHFSEKYPAICMLLTGFTYTNCSAEDMRRDKRRYFYKVAK